MTAIAPKIVGGSEELAATPAAVAVPIRRVIRDSDIDHESRSRIPVKALVFDAYCRCSTCFRSRRVRGRFPQRHALRDVRAKPFIQPVRSMIARYRISGSYAGRSRVLVPHPHSRSGRRQADGLGRVLTLPRFPSETGLQRLRAQGLRLAILSNGEPKMLRSAAKSAGIADLLDAIISVDEVRVFKPSPRVYELASSHLEITKSDIGFVSSNNWDVNGAGSAGLTAFGIRCAAEPRRSSPIRRGRRPRVTSFRSVRAKVRRI